MSAILLNSEGKISHCVNNNNLESDNLSDEGLFNSLFVIISQESKDNFIIENPKPTSNFDEDIVREVEKIVNTF